MSTRTNEGTAAASSFGMRPLWFIGGCLLWLLVIVGFLMIWQTRQVRKAAALQEMAASTAPSQSQPGGTANVATENSALTAQLSVPASRADEDDTQVIDLSTLMGQTKPAPAPSALWDPEGVEDFSFINSDGRTITKADLLGRPWVVCFVFTKCLGPCPTVTRQLKQLQDRLKNDDIRLVTLTVDPVRDTPEVLAKYAKLNGADPEKWYFLTGDQTEIYGLIHRSFKMPVQEVLGADRKEGFEIIHSTNVMLVDAQGVVRGKFNAAKDPEMAELRRELHELAVPLVESTPAESSSLPEETPVADGRQ